MWFSAHWTTRKKLSIHAMSCSTTALPTPTSPNKSALLPASNVGKQAVLEKSLQLPSTRGSQKKLPVRKILAIEKPPHSCKRAMEDCYDLLHKEPPAEVPESLSAVMSKATSKSTVNESDDAIAKVSNCDG